MRRNVNRSGSPLRLSSVALPMHRARGVPQARAHGGGGGGGMRGWVWGATGITFSHRVSSSRTSTSSPPLLKVMRARLPSSRSCSTSTMSCATRPRLSGAHASTSKDLSDSRDPVRERAAAWLDSAVGASVRGLALGGDVRCSSHLLVVLLLVAILFALEHERPPCYPTRSHTRPPRPCRHPRRRC